MNIGVALITNPHVLFLDEPTSGLDSQTANEVVSCMPVCNHAAIAIQGIETSCSLAWSAALSYCKGINELRLIYFDLGWCPCKETALLVGFVTSATMLCVAAR